MAKVDTTETKKTNGTKTRGAVRYWREMKGRLYARLQYRDEIGRLREKLKPITDKRTARTVVEAMRQELESKGPQALMNDRITFAEFAPLFNRPS